MGYAFELQVGVLDDFDSIRIFFDSCDDDSILVDSIIYFSFNIPLEFDLIDYRSSSLGDLDSSLVNSALVINIVEDIEVGNILSK